MFCLQMSGNSLCAAGDAVGFEVTVVDILISLRTDILMNR